MKLAQISIRTRLIAFALLAQVMLVAGSGYSLIIQHKGMIAFFHLADSGSVADAGRPGTQARPRPADPGASAAVSVPHFKPF